jgi:HSP20 family molecular chaperone IbpA
MKKLLLLPIIAILANASNLNSSSDPFEQMDKIFQMQMKQMQQMQKQMDEMFKVMESSMPVSSNMPVITNSGGIMSSGVQDKGDYYEVVLKSGDNAKMDVNVKAKDNLLTISVKQTKAIDKNSSYGVVKSFSSSSYMQTFTLPKDADAEKIDYEMKENKLIVKIPKKK